MKVVQINAYYAKGSTGKICKAISEELNKNGIENYVFYTDQGEKDSNSINYNLGKIYTLFESLKSKIIGNNGFNCKLITYRLVYKLKKIKPDIVHFHNLHAQNINLKIISNYLKDANIKVVITFHDCWLLTGYCMHFDMYNCDKWKSGCHNCEHHRKYSWFFDKSYENWNKKNNIISNLNPYITVPSHWLKEIVVSSKLKYSKCSVIYNGINLDIFHPTKSEIFNDIGDKHIILGVADRWDEKKGLDVFIKLSNELGDKYKIVLVGTNDKVDKILPNNIISIHRTENQKKLAEIYSNADLFVNATREEVLGLVNLEALACGTPVITFNTGGSPECINDKTGIVVEKNDINALIKEIEKYFNVENIDAEHCFNQARKFDEKQLYKQYYNLYKSILNEGRD